MRRKCFEHGLLGLKTDQLVQLDGMIGITYLKQQQQQQQPWPFFDTHQTYKRAMIREVERVLSLFSNYYNDETTFEPFPTRIENINECFCIV